MGGQSEPLVSVVTPVYNGAFYLKECIESVLAQTYSNWEYIIVNNCSTDETLQIAEEYARKEKRVQVHNNERFQEIIANHNCGTRIFQILSYERTHAESQSSASQQINRQLPQNLSDLLQYGPSYLSKDELDRQVCETLKFYHRFLAVNYFVGSKGRISGIIMREG